MKTTKPSHIDEYISAFPTDIQAILEQIRNTIKKAAPDALEAIKYDMPTFTMNGNLIHFAAFKKHIGVYPAPTGNKAFEEALAGYKTGKGSVQFPLSKPMPLDLITKIVKLQMKKILKNQQVNKRNEQVLLEKLHLFFRFTSMFIISLVKKTTCRIVVNKIAGQRTYES